MREEKKCYLSKYSRNEIKKIMRELKEENRFLLGYRFLGVTGGFVFNVRALEFYRFDEFNHRQFLVNARFKVGIEEKEEGTQVTVKEISPVSWLEMIIIMLLSMGIIAYVSIMQNIDFLSVLPVALLTIAAFLALNFFIYYCSNKYSDRNKECKYKGEMFLKNRLELKEINK